MASIIFTLEDCRKIFRLSKAINIYNVVVWVQLPDLPFDYWDREFILKIGVMADSSVIIDAWC